MSDYFISLDVLYRRVDPDARHTRELEGDQPLENDPGQPIYNHEDARSRKQNGWIRDRKSNQLALTTPGTKRFEAGRDRLAERRRASGHGAVYV